MVPGTDKPILNIEEAEEIAKQTGFPLLIKASAGGGGKGMRVVNEFAELAEQLQMAKSEALNSFNDDSVFIEKYVASPKHIEIQLLGDTHGNYVYLLNVNVLFNVVIKSSLKKRPHHALPKTLEKPWVKVPST